MVGGGRGRWEGREREKVEHDGGVEGEKGSEVKEGEKGETESGGKA